DYVIATGVQHSVRDFVNVAALELGINLRWEGSGVNEKGIDAATGLCLVAVDPRYYRPTEVETLLGDATKAREKLGWAPRVSFHDLVKEMVTQDLQLAKKDALCQKEGYQVFEYQE